MGSSLLCSSIHNKGLKWSLSPSRDKKNAFDQPELEDDVGKYLEDLTSTDRLGLKSNTVFLWLVAKMIMLPHHLNPNFQDSLEVKLTVYK